MKMALGTNASTRRMTPGRHKTKTKPRTRLPQRKRTPMTTTRLNRTTALVVASLILAGGPSQARADDFGKIVHSIEVNYNVRHNHRWVMAFAGVVVKVAGGFAGVKGFKAALFEDQHLLASNPDSSLDEVVQSAGEHGWQPVVKSYSRRHNEHNYIYARQEGKDLKLLIVSVEPDEAVVVQVKINPDKFVKFIDESEGRRHQASNGRMAFR